VFCPDGKLLASAGSRGPIRLWDTSNWNEVMALGSATSSIDSLAFSPDGTLLASCGHGLAGEDVAPERRDYSKMYPFSEIGLWGMPKGQSIAVLREDRHPGMCGLAFSPDGKSLAVGGGRDERVHLFDVVTRE